MVLEAPNLDAPTAGALVDVRDRRWVVVDVQRGMQPRYVLGGPDTGPQHLVTLASVDDDEYAEPVPRLFPAAVTLIVPRAVALA